MHSHVAQRRTHRVGIQFVAADRQQGLALPLRGGISKEALYR
jgi:hypothetical protein